MDSLVAYVVGEWMLDDYRADRVLSHRMVTVFRTHETFRLKPASLERFITETRLDLPGGFYSTCRGAAEPSRKPITSASHVFGYYDDPHDAFIPEENEQAS